MKVMQKNMLEFMEEGDMRFVIPAYQRLYSWNETQCEELWLDILRAARGKHNHFLGTVLYNVAYEGKTPDHIEIIDGQQRLTSVSLVILALARYLESHPRSCSADTSDAATLISRYLVMSEADGSDPITKLLPSHHDASPYDAVIRGGDGNPMSSITRNLSFFQEKMAEDDFDYEQLLEGLRRLTTIFVEVDDFRDAQPIFESVNSKGMPLNVADMVRNYLLLTESHDEQTRLFEEYWKVSQEMFAPDPSQGRSHPKRRADICFVQKIRRRCLSGRQGAHLARASWLLPDVGRELPLSRSQEVQVRFGLGKAGGSCAHVWLQTQESG